jgi:predicted GNAT family acetyltransferase
MKPLTIEHDPARGRFQTRLDGFLGVCDYRLEGDVMQMVHTEVDPALEGRGIAAALVEAAFAHARVEGLKVLPLCSYVRAWARRHPETADLLAGR